MKMNQNPVVLASTVFEAQVANKWVDQNGSRTKPIDKVVQTRKKATSVIETYHENYY